MRRSAVLFGLLVCLADCTSSTSSAEEPDVERLRFALAQRETKLGGFQAVFTSSPVDPLEQKRRWRVAFRPPAALRIDVLSPKQMTHLYDGDSYSLSADEEAPRTQPLPSDAAHRAAVLAETFRPFLPEGFRAPLFPSRGTHVKRIPHPKGPVALAITTEVPQGSATPLRVTTVLRWPSGDFLETRWLGNDGRAEVTMHQEQCSPQAICLPTLLSHSRNGVRTSETKVEHLQMGRPSESVFALAVAGPNNSRR